MIELIVKVLYFFDAILNYEFSIWQYIGLGVICMLSIIMLEVYCRRKEKDERM